jgi:hypothetical protein
MTLVSESLLSPLAPRIHRLQRTEPQPQTWGKATEPLAVTLEKKRALGQSLRTQPTKALIVE